MPKQREKSELTLMEPIYVEEPHRSKEYAEVLSRASAEHHPVVVRRHGVAVAAIISLEHLQVLQDALARREAEQLAARIDWSRLVSSEPPAQWLEGDEPKPF